jgi:transposase-like protein
LLGAAHLARRSEFRAASPFEALLVNPAFHTVSPMRYAHTCPGCGLHPAGEPLGQLSSNRWFRCRNCGRHFTKAVATRSNRPLNRDMNRAISART